MSGCVWVFSTVLMMMEKVSAVLAYTMGQSMAEALVQELVCQERK